MLRDGLSPKSCGDISRRIFLTTNQIAPEGVFPYMIRKLKAGGYRLYSRKKDAKTGKRKNLGTFSSRAGAEKHERAVQYFKRA